MVTLKRDRGIVHPHKRGESLLAVSYWREPHYIYSVRSVLPRSEWGRLSNAVKKAAGDRCERCGGTSAHHEAAPNAAAWAALGISPAASAALWRLEAHEIWEYLDREKNHQRLAGIAALCPDCHHLEHQTKDLHAGRIGVARADFAVASAVLHAEADASRVIGNYIEVDWDALASKYSVRLSRSGHEILQLVPVRVLKRATARSTSQERVRSNFVDEEGAERL